MLGDERLINAAVRQLRAVRNGSEDFFELEIASFMDAGASADIGFLRATDYQPAGPVEINLPGAFWFESKTGGRIHGTTSTGIPTQDSLSR